MSGSGKTALLLPAIQLHLALGWTKAERLKLQPVNIAIKLTFATPPLACYDEKLELTTCYDTLIQNLKSYLSKRECKLIEFLSQDIYTFLKAALPTISINVRVQKFPPIKELTQGVYFFYGDDATTW
jgi:FolB domain-containing protein